MGIILELVDSFFKKDGLLAQIIPEFEYRESQYNMAINIAKMFEDGGVYIIESGTGTGKTYAYLIPAILSGQRVVISTKTKNLQEQLYFKDLSLLNSYFKFNPRAIYIKGRNNYICIKRFTKFFQKKIFFDNELNMINKWIDLTESGDLSELNEIYSNKTLMNQIASNSDTCFGIKCEFFKRCFINKLKINAEKSDLIIVNHHLLFSDLKIKETKFGRVLPDYKFLICDEAHSIENIATEHFGETISKYQLLFFLMEVDSIDEKITVKAKDIVSEIFDKELKGNVKKNLNEFDVDKLRILADSLIYELNLISERMEDEKFISKVQDLIFTLDKIFFDESHEYIKWVDYGLKNTTINCSPIEVSSKLNSFFQNLKGVLLTSATLSISNNFEYIKSRFGIEYTAFEKVYPSPFNYKKQTIFFVPEDIPEPFSKDFTDILSEYIVNLINLTEGNALILFTSLKNLEIVSKKIKQKIKYPVFVQGESSNIDLIENFKIKKNSILMGSYSFWEGIDFEAENLKLLIIDKLPFSPPNDPVKTERIKFLKEEGKNPFYDYQIPEAIMFLKQGFGRLIRSRKHRGIFAIFDIRILKKNYGKFFIKNLPEMKIIKNFKELSKKFKEFSLQS